MIKISIVTITYNAASVLSRTLESVFAQDYAEVEHFIVDGKSKDETVAIANHYSQRVSVGHPSWKVDVKSEPDKGLYDAMNKGLQKATGDYIVFLNAGDCFPNANTLITVAEQAQCNPKPAVVYGDTDVMDDEGNFLFHRRLSPPEHLTWRSFKHGMLVCHQAFYARVDIAQRIPYDLQYRYSADVDWCIKIMKEAERMKLPLANTHTVLANYLQEGQTTLHHRDSLKERFHVMCKHYGWFTTVGMHFWFVLRKVFK